MDLFLIALSHFQALVFVCYAYFLWSKYTGFCHLASVYGGYFFILEQQIGDLELRSMSLSWGCVRLGRQGYCGAKGA